MTLEKKKRKHNGNFFLILIFATRQKLQKKRFLRNIIFTLLNDIDEKYCVSFFRGNTDLADTVRSTQLGEIVFRWAVEITTLNEASFVLVTQIYIYIRQ